MDTFILIVVFHIFQTCAYWVYTKDIYIDKYDITLFESMFFWPQIYFGILDFKYPHKK